MAISPTGYRAIYEPLQGSGAPELPVLHRSVVQWGNDGTALVVDERGGRLVPASIIGGFVRLEPVDYPVVGALPPDGWRISTVMGARQPDLVEDIMGWAVHADGTLSPITPGTIGQGELAVHEDDGVKLLPPRPTAGPEGWLALHEETSGDKI